MRELGSGGMGTVYEAFDEQMRRPVALKVMSRHQGSAEKAHKRFEQEAWIAGKLDHPNLVKVYERGTWEELSYFSMEMADGGSLADVVQRMKAQGRDDSRGLAFGSSAYVHWAIRKTIEAARGLDYAHRRGVVHRDVKPMNLLLSREPDAVKIADFGLAIDAEATRLTTAGKVLGTVSYMPAEQILGKQDQIDPRTDVFALGVTLFELLTLELPFKGTTQQMYMSQVLTGETRRASKLNALVSRDLETVLRKAMERDRADRYQTASAFAEDLEKVLALRPISARPSSFVKRTSKWIRRKRVHAALLATLVLALPTLGYLSVREFKHRQAVNASMIEDMLKEARWLTERKRHTEALELGSRVLAIDRSHVSGLRQRAITQMYLSLSETDAEEARRLETAALADASRILEQEPGKAWPHALKAFMLLQWGREDESRRERELARQNRSGQMSDDELDLEATLAMSDERFEQAVEFLSRLILRQPDNAAAIGSRGYAYDALGRDEVALNEYRLAIGLNPELNMVYIDLARLAKDRGAHEEAAQYLERALELDPDSAHVHEALAMNLVDRGTQAAIGEDIETALDYLRRGEAAARRSIELNPKRPWAYLNLGASLVEQGRLRDSDPQLITQAVDAYDQALSMMDVPTRRGDPETYVIALSNTCDALIELRQLDRALQVCRQVIEELPDDPTAYYNLAGLQALLGRTSQALDALERDIELGDRDWRYLEHDMWFESIRDDPRFVSLIERMKRNTTRMESRVPDPG